MILNVLSAALLFSLSVPVVMRYRILPVDGTPYWLFGILFVVLLVNLFLSLYHSIVDRFRHVTGLKSILLWVVIGITLGGVMMTSIVDRSKTAPIAGVHDIILQQEAAMRFLLEGKNPYKETYFGTPLEQWHYDEQGKSAVNPALYHFVMPPWYLLFPLPFYFFSVPLLGYFDARIVLLFCVVGTLLVLARWLKDKTLSTLAIIMTALSPATVDYLIEGRSDMFVLFWFLLSLFLLEHKHYIVASFMFALAMLSKQSIWIALPYFILYQWIVQKKTIQSVLLSLSIIGIVVTAVTLPFLLWDARAFFDSVIFYLSGSALHSYPVSGYGLGMLLYEFRVIKNIHDTYPFAIWQILMGLPVLVTTLWWLAKKPLLSRLILGYGISLFVIWYTSRYFNNSHIGYLISVFAIGALKSLDEKDSS